MTRRTPPASSASTRCGCGHWVSGIGRSEALRPDPLAPRSSQVDVRFQRYLHFSSPREGEGNVPVVEADALEFRRGLAGGTSLLPLAASIICERKRRSTCEGQEPFRKDLPLHSRAVRYGPRSTRGTVSVYVRQRANCCRPMAGAVASRNAIAGGGRRSTRTAYGAHTL
jgi:hypothetical protein